MKAIGEKMRRASGGMEITIEDILSEPNLYRAWESVSRKNGGAGLDHVTVSDYARHVREEFASICRDVRSKAYEAGPLMVFPREKAGGGCRELTIACIRDRILGRAIAQVMNERLDEGFAPQSYAYRFRKGALRAVSAAQRACTRFPYVLRGDIADFFDTMDHELLQSLLDQAGISSDVRDLAMKLVRAPRFDGVSSQPGVLGVPQGSPLSPVLSNLYLDPLDRAIAKEYPHFIRYADDLVVFCPDADQASGAMRRLGEWLGDLKLGLAVNKTRIYRVQEGFLFLGFHFTPSGHSAGQEARTRLQEKLGEGPCADESASEYATRRASIERGWNNYFRHGETVDAEPFAHEAGSRACESRETPEDPVDRVTPASADGHAGDHDEPEDVSLLDLRRQLAGDVIDPQSMAWREMMQRLADRYEKAGLMGAANACRRESGSSESGQPAVSMEPVRHGCRSVERWMDLFAGGEGNVNMACIDRLGRLGYRPYTAKLTPELLEHHWEGRRTLAVPVYLSGDRVRFGVIDIDISRKLVESLTTGERAVRLDGLKKDAIRMAERARAAGVACLVESSGYKGFHVWFFLHQPVEAAVMRRFLSEVVRVSGPPPVGSHRELFPSSDERPPEGLQTHIRLPLGLHKLTGERSCWITPAGEAWTAGPDAIDLALLNRVRNIKLAVQQWTKYQADNNADEKECKRTGDEQGRRTGNGNGAETKVARLCSACAVLGGLARKAEIEKDLAHGERMVVRGILEPLGEPGRTGIHDIMAKCGNYDARKTDSFLGRAGIKPMACRTIREVLGTFCEGVGCDCRFKTRKGEYAHPLRHLVDRPTAQPKEVGGSLISSSPAKGEGREGLLDLVREFHEARVRLLEVSGRIEQACAGGGANCGLGHLVRESADPDIPRWTIRA